MIIHGYVYQLNRINMVSMFATIKERMMMLAWSLVPLHHTYPVSRNAGKQQFMYVDKGTLFQAVGNGTVRGQL